MRAGADSHGYYEVNFSIVPKAIQRCFHLEALLSVEGMAEQERDAVVASLQQEKAMLRRERALDLDHHR
jgi:hypothetical protein